MAPRPEGTEWQLFLLQGDPVSSGENFHACKVPSNLTDHALLARPHYHTTRNTLVARGYLTSHYEPTAFLDLARKYSELIANHRVLNVLRGLP